MKIDWTACAEIEVAPGRMGGQPVLKDSRVRPQDLLANRTQGAEWLAENHGLPVEQVRAVLDFYDRHRRRVRAAAPSP